MLRNYHHTDVKRLVEIFEKSILAIDERFYNHEQKSVWIDNRSFDFWQARFAKSLPIIALYQGKIVGFAEFLIDNQQSEIDCFYIDPNYQGLGIGEKLLNYILAVAKDNNLDVISVNASHNAKLFFKKYGFKTVQKNVITRNNIILENWQMTLDFVNHSI